jgi:hypothetical protein
MDGHIDSARAKETPLYVFDRRKETSDRFNDPSLVPSPASLGRLLGTIRWSRMGLLQFGHLGVSIEACDNEVIGGHFACRQGRLPYTCPIETPYGRSVGDMRLPPASADTVSFRHSTCGKLELPQLCGAYGIVPYSDVTI